MCRFSLQKLKSISAAELDKIYSIIFPARSTQDEVYNQIIKDFWNGPGQRQRHQPYTKGIATKGAVNAMLAKVYATR